METTSIQALYGQDLSSLPGQARRYARALTRFAEVYGSGPTLVLRTPGRINLIGEHTDYNGGFVLPVALDRDVLCIVGPRTDSIVRAVNTEDAFQPFSFCLSTDIQPAPRGDWSNYVRGAGQELCRHLSSTTLRGADLCISGSAPFGVPRGSGLSSSTALTVAAALAFVVANEIEIDRASLAHLCSEAEWYVGTRGGMMDQFSALLSRRNYALFLDCRPISGRYALDHVPIPEGVQIVLLNSGVRHENVRSEFNQRVAECKIGVRLLQQRFPGLTDLRDTMPENVGLDATSFWTTLGEILPVRTGLEELVHRGLDPCWLDALLADHHLSRDRSFCVLPRCRHVITENQRVLDAVATLRAGDVERFGALVDLAHASMSIDYEASCPEVDFLAATVRQQPGVLGARITGAGWGGGVVALVRSGCIASWEGAVRAAYRWETGLDCEIVVCQPGDGARLISI